MRSSRAVAVMATLLGLAFTVWCFGLPRARTGRQFLDGVVVDSVGPIKGASVHFKGRPGAIITEVDGRFQLTSGPFAPQTITASKVGYLIGSASDEVQPIRLIKLKRLPDKDNQDYCWVDPTPRPSSQGNCGNCHSQIYKEWAQSSHGHSSVNRFFLNLYDGTDWHGKVKKGWNLLADNLAGAAVCNACHAPTASFDTDLRYLGGVSVNGIHCDYCHKVVNSDLTHVGLTHGRYALDLLRPSKGQLFFGPLDDVDREEDSFSPLYQDSRYCASCHEGVVFGVHSYGTYSEWLQSSASRSGKQCQTCHMGPTGRFANVAPGHGGIERDPISLASHSFPGGTPEMLRRSLKLSVRAQDRDGSIEVQADLIATEVGHRVPTGYPDRHLILKIVGLGESAEAIPFLKGSALPPTAGKDFAGAPGKLFAKQLKSPDGRLPAPLWRADPKFLDTRLVPDRVDTTIIIFPAAVKRLHVSLVYRRFWSDVSEAKAWPKSDIKLVGDLINFRRDRAATFSWP